MTAVYDIGCPRSPKVGLHNVSSGVKGPLQSPLPPAAETTVYRSHRLVQKTDLRLM